jgi:hypothetical protein
MQAIETDLAIQARGPSLMCRALLTSGLPSGHTLGLVFCCTRPNWDGFDLVSKLSSAGEGTALLYVQGILCDDGHPRDRADLSTRLGNHRRHSPHPALYEGRAREGYLHNPPRGLSPNSRLDSVTLCRHSGPENRLGFATGERKSMCPVKGCDATGEGIK